MADEMILSEQELKEMADKLLEEADPAEEKAKPKKKAAKKKEVAPEEPQKTPEEYLQELLEKGKKKGNLTTKELSVLEELNLDSVLLRILK